ncbi:VanZ family protein [Roseburia hominis]
MHLQILWNIKQETYIFIIAIWLIIAVLLKGSRHNKRYLIVSSVIYTLILLYVTLLGCTASTEYKMELSFLWEYRLALNGHTAGGCKYSIILCFFSNGLDIWRDTQRCGSSQGERSQCGVSQWLKAIIFGLCASALIEFCQLVFKLGLFEFDDILNNTVGRVVGYGLYVRFGRAREIV